METPLKPNIVARNRTLATTIYIRLGRPRRRTIDLAIAACAMVQGAALWTLNPRDFSDIPGLELIE